MWVTLSDGTNSAKFVYGTYGDDPEDIKLAEWIDMNIELADFVGVDLSNVEEMSIGFGDNVTNVPDDAMGIMRFDDIAVCPVRCVPRYTPDIDDLNGDCVVDNLDIKIIAQYWLEWRLEPPVRP